MSKKIRAKKELTEEEIAAQEAEAQVEEEVEVQDEFQAKGFEIAEWAQEQSSRILVAIGAIVAIAIVYSLITMSGGSKNVEAAQMFIKAQDVFQAKISDKPDDTGKKTFKTAEEKTAKTKLAFEKLISEANGSDVMPLAYLYKGHDLRNAEKFNESIIEYEQFLSASSANNPLRAVAYDAIANAYLSLNNQDKAVASLDKLLQLKSKALKDYTLLKVAKIKIEQGKKDEAQNYITQLKEKYSDSALVAEAETL